MSPAAPSGPRLDDDEIIDIGGEQQTKTRKALEFFAERLKKA